jgi:hypothetical protein
MGDLLTQRLNPLNILRKSGTQIKTNKARGMVLQGLPDRGQVTAHQYLSEIGELQVWPSWPGIFFRNNIFE